jgi:hypothetical protein
MARLCTCLHDEFSDEAGASDDQNLAFLSHLDIFGKKIIIQQIVGETRKGEEALFLDVFKYDFSGAYIQKHVQLLDVNCNQIRMHPAITFNVGHYYN